MKFFKWVVILSLSMLGGAPFAIGIDWTRNQNHAELFKDDPNRVAPYGGKCMTGGDVNFIWDAT